VVRVGQVVALVEAMKVFNEIHTDRGGRVVRFGVTPGDVVSAGTPLVYLQPDDRPSGDEG
jgi:biotin carboxyl carrier protein